MEHRVAIYAIAWRPGVFSVRLSLQIFAVGVVIPVFVKHTDAIFSSRFFMDHKTNRFIFKCHRTFLEVGVVFNDFFR